jgi:hypothetical protein
MECARIARIRWSFDERVEDGLYAGYGLKHMQRLVEDPVRGGIADGDAATLAGLRAAELDLTAPDPAGDAPVAVDE